MKKSRIATLALAISLGLGLSGTSAASAEPTRFSTWVLGQYDASLTIAQMDTITGYVAGKCEWAAGSNVAASEITTGGVQNGLYKAKRIRVNQAAASYIAGFLQACARQ